MSGEVVSTASRIQSAAPVGGVAVGERTFLATRRVFDFEPLAAGAARGNGEPGPVWQVLAAKGRFGSDVLRPAATPLVGREFDLALLRGMFDKAAAERTVQLVTVVGEPGVGKSRLVAELARVLDDRPGRTTWRQGRCLPYGDGITFWALGEIVKAHAGIYESDSPEAATEKLEAVLPESDDRPWLRARLLPLLGIESSPAAQEEAFTAWRRFLESVAEAGPAVLVFENVHWADDALLDFIEHLADWSQGVPLLLVCTTRPELYETHPSWGAGLANQTAIRLSPLSNGETAQLVSALLDQDALSPHTQPLLLERAGGNPLYAEEFVRMLRDRGLLNGRGTLEAEAAVPVPDSLQALIAARLDTLPPERKRLLQDAAVMGQVFWAGSLAAMGKRDPNEVRQVLHELVRKELIRPALHSSMEGEAEYGFWHLLIRDVIYGQIPRAQRAARHISAAHISAAQWLEAKAGKRIEDLAEVLAYHTGEALSLAQASGETALAAELAPAAGRYALLAGERALGLDTGKALTLLERARGLISESDPSYPLILFRWADAMYQAGRHREAATALESAISTFQASGDSSHAGEALATLSSVRWALGDPAHVATAEQAVALLEQQSAPELLAALAQLAGSNYSAGAYASAIDAAERALKLAEQHELPVPGRALGFRGAARCFLLGDLDGLADMERALDVSVAQGRGRDAAVVHATLACLRWYLEGPSAALAPCAEATAFAAARGLAGIAQFVAINRVQILVGLGRLADALAEAETLAPALQESGSLFGLCELRACQTRALAEQGRSAAIENEETLRIARSSEDPLTLAVAAAGAAHALLAAGRRDDARALLDEVAAADIHHPDYAVQLPLLTRAAAELEDPDLVARLVANVADTLPIQQHALATARGHRAEATGDCAEAAALHAVAAARWEQFGDVLEQAHALLGQGRCLTRLADPAAEQPLRCARALFADMGAQARVADCDTLIVQAALPSAQTQLSNRTQVPR